jgi:hypothetical protein
MFGGAWLVRRVIGRKSGRTWARRWACLVFDFLLLFDGETQETQRDFTDFSHRDFYSCQAFVLKHSVFKTRGGRSGEKTP